MMKIIYKDISEITPYENNPRLNEEAVPLVANSIKEFGWKVPMVIDADGVIVAGHTRYKAAQKLGIREIPCIIADDLTEDQIRAYRLADNKTAEASDWDFDALDLEFGSIEMDMTPFGFDEDPVTEDIQVEEDDYEVVLPEEPRSKKGDVYQLGDHRLMCGDSTDPGDVKVLMNGNLADIVFTDPPWNVSYGERDNPKWKSRTILNDSMTTEDFKDFMGAVFERMKDALRGGESHTS